MGEYQSMFIDFATSIASKSFSISYASGLRGTKPYTFLKLNFRYLWSNPARQWSDGYFDYEKDREIPAVWQGKKNPWENLSFAGELELAQFASVAKDTTPKFCSQCGESIPPGAKFCGGCGVPVKVLAINNRSTTVTALPEGRDFVEGATLTRALSARFAEIVVSALYADFEPDERTILLRFFEDELFEANVQTVVNARESTSSHPINLKNMQDLQAAVLEGRPLSSNESELAELALREAPICFGYWGAIKALLKCQPENVSTEALGVAFARISDRGSINNTWWSAERLFEDISVLSEFQRVPTAKTRYHLSRRGRRSLVKLASVRPADFVKMSVGFLLVADRDTSPNDFVLGHILYGGARYLNERSRSVINDLIATLPTPYRPDLWKKASTEINLLWTGTTRSRQIQDFTFLIAEIHKLPLSPLYGSSVNLALRSAIPQLRSLAIAQVIESTKDWNDLDKDGWAIVLNEVDEDALPRMFDTLDELDYTYALRNAVEELLSVTSDPRELKVQHLANLYFKLEPEFLTWRADSEFEGKAAAALMCSENKSGLTAEHLLSERLGFKGLLVCRTHLYEHGVLSTESDADFAEAAFNYWDHFSVNQRTTAFRVIATLAPDWFPYVGSELVKRYPGEEHVNAFVDAVRELPSVGGLATHAFISISHVLPAADIAGVIGTVLEDRELAATISLDDLLNESPQLRMAAWSEIGDGSNSVLAQSLLQNAPLLTSTMFEIQRSDVAQASEAQAQLLLEFFTKPKIQGQIPDQLVLGAASNPYESLALLGHSLLKKRSLLATQWLSLAETQMPLAIGFARDYLKTLKGDELSSGIVLAADSPVAVVRDLGLELLDFLRDKIDVPSVYARLAESRDPVVRGRVAEEALLSPWSDGTDLVSFDTELLVTLRRTRTARENVKSRVDKIVREQPETFAVTNERLNALISLTRIGSTRDREWALARIARLKLVGVEVEGVSLSILAAGESNV